MNPMCTNDVRRYMMQDANTVEGMQSSDYTQLLMLMMLLLLLFKINELSIDVKKRFIFLLAGKFHDKNITSVCMHA